MSSSTNIRYFRQNIWFYLFFLLAGSLSLHCRQAPQKKQTKLPTKRFTQSPTKRPTERSTQSPTKQNMTAAQPSAKRTKATPRRPLRRLPKVPVKHRTTKKKEPSHERLKRDRRAWRIAKLMQKEAGWKISVAPRQIMKGGWRGRLLLVPEWPVGKYRYHLRWVYLAMKDYQAFFKWIRSHAKKPIRYRWKNIKVDFFRSVRRRTPSAYAWHWTVSYNVRGSLLRSARGVRETIFHEIFHLNDESYKNWWSDGPLKVLYESIIKRCTNKKGKLSNRCLKPYAPHHTIIRRFGIYYAFHPESGVVEYAAELAIRYYREHRRIFKKRRRYKPFKCITPENAKAWKAMTETFFGGVDLTGSCKK